jgi:hypothetical protein
MRLDFLARTDTATLVFFDVASLRDRLHADVDWWTGDGDLETAEAAGSLAFIATGQDGFFPLVVSDKPPPDTGSRLLKETTLRAPSGRICFGAGEHLPAEGTFTENSLGRASLTPGDYAARIFEREDGYWIELTWHPAGACPKPALAATDLLAGEGSAAERGPLSPAELVALLDQPETAAALAGVVARLSGWETFQHEETHYYKNADHGLEIILKSGVIHYVHLTGPGAERKGLPPRVYPFPLPENLAWGAAKSGIAARYGTPFKGTGTFWAIYRLPHYGIRVGYAGEKLAALNLLSLRSKFLVE